MRDKCIDDFNCGSKIQKLIFFKSWISKMSNNEKVTGLMRGRSLAC